MIFQHTWRKVLTGEKSQTRRLVKANERQSRDYIGDELRIACVKRSDGSGWVDSNDPVVYAVHGWLGNDKTYAITPARTHPTLIYHPEHPCYGIDIIDPGDDHYQMAKSGEWNYRGQGYIQARIRITDIRREDVRNISEADALAEGFQSREDFWDTWVAMHDKFFLSDYRYASDKDYLKEYGFFERPDKRYDAWVLNFEVVR